MTLPPVPSIDLLRKAAGKIRHGTTGRGLGRDAPLDTMDWAAVEAGLALLDLVIESEAQMRRVSEISRGAPVSVLRPPRNEDFSIAAHIVRLVP